MRRDSLFQLLRSANTLIFFGVGLLMLALLSYVAYQILGSMTRERRVSDVVNTQPLAQAATKTVLGTFNPVIGTPYLLGPIITEQDYRGSYYEKEASATRNYLFVNQQDKSAQRLIANNQGLIIRAEQLGTKNSKGNLVKAEGLWYVVASKDTNGDQRITANDKQAIAVSAVSGANYTTVIPSLDRLLWTQQIAVSKLLVIYGVGTENFVTEVDLAIRTATPIQALPSIN